MQTINFWGILVVSVISFIIGAFWYSPILFGKEWMKLVGISEKEMKDSSMAKIWKLYAIQFGVTFIEFLILGFVISMTSSNGAGDGALIAFLIWLGFNATEAAGKILWEKKSLKLIMISSGATLLSLMIGGIILGVWK